MYVGDEYRAPDGVRYSLIDESELNAIAGVGRLNEVSPHVRSSGGATALRAPRWPSMPTRFLSARATSSERLNPRSGRSTFAATEPGFSPDPNRTPWRAMTKPMTDAAAA